MIMYTTDHDDLDYWLICIFQYFSLFAVMIVKVDT